MMRARRTMISRRACQKLLSENRHRTMRNPTLSTPFGCSSLIITVSLVNSSVPLHLTHQQDPNTPARKPDNAVYMEATKIQSVQIMQPQYRNRHNFMIFGGFLLKSTFELAFTCASAYSHIRPKFIALDPSTFENPVPVGSVLYLTATVAYTDSSDIPVRRENAGPLWPQSILTSKSKGSTRIQVRVDSKIRNIEHGETKPTGQFNYTFEVQKDIKVIPQTYSQFIVYLDARRRARQVNATLATHSIHEVTENAGLME